jgi:hypothetical protein
MPQSRLKRLSLVEAAKPKAHSGYVVPCMDEAGPKTKFEVKKTINGQEREAISHEVDHVRAFANGLVALEIEWNNKDPFFDRDLENYKRLHADGAISLGVIVTRGRSLHESMRDLVRRFLDERQIQDLDGLREWGYEPTSRQRAAIDKRVFRAKAPLTFREAFTDHARVRRGVGNPCPLVLVGLPASIVTFHEGKRALAEVEEAESEEGEASVE